MNKHKKNTIKMNKNTKIIKTESTTKKICENENSRTQYVVSEK